MRNAPPVLRLWETPYDVVAGIGGRRRLSGAYYSAWVALLIGLAAFVSVFARF